MKNLLLTSTLFFLASSCCKGGAAVSRSLIIHYPNITEDFFTIGIIRTNANDFSQVIDTTTGYLISSNQDYQTGISFDDTNENPNYIIYVENTNYQDTITDIDILIENKKCKNEKTLKFEYKLNGVLTTDREIFIED